MNDQDALAPLLDDNLVAMELEPRDGAKRLFQKKVVIALDVMEEDSSGRSLLQALHELSESFEKYLLIAHEKIEDIPAQHHGVALCGAMAQELQKGSIKRIRGIRDMKVRKNV